MRISTIISSLAYVLGIITTSLLGLYIILFYLFKSRNIELNNKHTKVNMETMPVLRPIPIATANQEGWLNKILVFVFLIRRWRVEEAFIFEYDDKKYVIPAGFEFDGASIPRPLWAILNPVGLLLIPGLIHDFGYRYNCIYIIEGNDTPVLKHQNENQEHWDELFRKIGNDVNGIPLLNWLAQLGLKYGGFVTWNHWREANLSPPNFKWTLKGYVNDSDKNTQADTVSENNFVEEELQSGTTKTTEIGYVNANQQKVHGTRKRKGSDQNQLSYKVECLLCHEIYGSNGADIYRRKCPKCQDGKNSIEY